MARYDYRCPRCFTTREVTHNMNETPEVHCENDAPDGSDATCNERMEKVIGAGFGGNVFKGNGFYITDNKHVIKSQSDTY